MNRDPTGLDNQRDEEDSDDRSEDGDVDIEARQQALDELTEQAQDLDMGY